MPRDARGVFSVPGRRPERCDRRFLSAAEEENDAQAFEKLYFLPVALLP
jgi:hypothetical protein